MNELAIAAPCIPARRRISSSHTTFIFDEGVLMNAMSFIAGVTQAVSAYRAAAQTLDEAKIASATNELQIQLTHLGAEVIAMQKERVQATEREGAALRAKNDLADKVRELERRASERDRYELVDVFMGSFAYKLKSSSSNGEPVHYVCQSCLDNRDMKVVLQRHISGGKDAKCPECNTGFTFNWYRA